MHACYEAELTRTLRVTHHADDMRGLKAAVPTLSQLFLRRRKSLQVAATVALA